jgi:hypothetical protein
VSEQMPEETNPDPLRVQIQQRMKVGSLPCEDCLVTWYGSGCGRICAGCDQPILREDHEIECTVPNGGMIYFHRACYEVWHGLLAPG